jgi:choloylglycine hydrolase
LPTPGEKPLTWVATYGSVSFNQNGRELPCGGINEAGLVIEQMMHESPKSRYP